MKKSRNKELRKALRSFCKSAVSLLLLKHREGVTLIHISGIEAEVDDTGRIITPVESFTGTDNMELNYVIITHGDLPDYLTFISNCWNDLEISPEFDSCKTEMERDAKISRHLGIIVGALGRAATHDVKFFIQYFLDELLFNSKGIRWDEQSFSDVYENLEDFFYSDVVRYTAFAAIWGFHKWYEVDSSKIQSGIIEGRPVLSRTKGEAVGPVQFTKRARILPTMESSIYKHFYIQGGFLPPVLGTWDFPYILELSGATRKYFRESRKHRVVPAYQQMDSEISRLIGSIRLFKKGDIQFRFLGYIIHGWFRRTGKISLPSPQRPITHFMYDINSEEEKELCKFCKRFTIIKPNESLELAMNRFNLSYERNRLEDNLIDQFVAFEALLIQTDDKSIRKTLSRRCANLISNSISEKQIGYDEMYDAYYIRSKIVHGDRNKEITSILESKKKKLIWYVYDIQELLRQSIRKYAQLVNEGQSKTHIINGHNHRIPERPKKHRTGV